MGRLGLLMVALPATALMACSIDPLDLEGRACPCITGWSCVDEVCVQDAADGGMDAGLDAAADSGSDGGFDGGSDAGSDAGTDDSGVDSAVDAPPPDTTVARETDCDDSSYLFCDGFEDGLEGIWGLSSETTDSVVVDAPTFLGRGALGSAGDARNGFSVVFQDDLFPDDTTDLWIRGYFYFPSGMSPGIEVLGIWPSSEAYVVNVWMHPESTANIHTHGLLGDEGWSEGIAPVVNTWHCIETHVHRDALAGYVETFIDEELAGRSPDQPLVETFNGFAVGMAYHDVDAIDSAVYVDEVAADTSRIPCR